MHDLGNIFILGDSYSTFTGLIPEGYGAWYTPTPKPETDVTEAGQIWHQQLLRAIDGRLIMNDSWSGSTICCTGYDGKDFSHCAYIHRLDRYIAEDFFEKNRIDTLLVLGGTNDSWSDAPVGKLQHGGWTKEDLYQVLPAVSYLTHRLKECRGNMRLLFIINTELKEEITQGILDACVYNDIPTLRLQDIDKRAGHPTIAGMRQISQQVLQYFSDRENTVK